MKTAIKDDFSLEKIVSCGQNFRATKKEDGSFQFLYQDKILSIFEISPSEFEVDTDLQTWETVWKPYFDLDRNYSAIRQTIPSGDLFMQNAANDGAGIRILRQDPWEVLITFIISQRKSIPSIKQSVELLAERYGSPIKTSTGTCFAFPTAQQLSYVTEDELRSCKVGYRAPYLRDAVNAVLEKRLDLEQLYSFSYLDLINSLMTIKGVGIKVANCVALFAYGQVSAAPVDTWIQKIISSEYSEMNPFPTYGSAAGIMQQYAFYYALNHKSEISKR